MILFHIVHYIDDVFLDFVVSLPAYWFTRVIYMDFISILIPIILILFGRRIHDIGFNAWAGILWSVIIISSIPILLYRHSITCLNFRMAHRASLFLGIAWSARTESIW